MRLQKHRDALAEHCGKTSQGLRGPCFPDAPSWGVGRRPPSPWPASLPSSQGCPHPGAPSSLYLGWTLWPISAHLRSSWQTCHTQSEHHAFCCCQDGTSVSQLLSPEVFSPGPFALRHCHPETCGPTTQTLPLHLSPLHRAVLRGEEGDKGEGRREQEDQAPKICLSTQRPGQQETLG